MKIFERITKRYALQNYYLRRNFYWPDTLPEILDYWQQHNDLPFLYGGDNWPYDAMCERQRRKGVYASQYLIPDRTDAELVDLYERLYPETAALRMQFHEIDFRCENVIANPPFEIVECVYFLQWLSRTQRSGDRAVLLLPYGFIDKQRPKAVQETMRHFIIHHRTPMQEPFARTACRAEIVVVERA